VYEAAGVDSAFWFTFAGYRFPDELDVASYGVVRVRRDGGWDRKAAFHALAEAYAGS